MMPEPLGPVPSAEAAAVPSCSGSGMTETSEPSLRLARVCEMRFDTVHHDYVCSGCGAFVRTDASRRLDGSASLKYCPNCGRKVVSDAL